MTTPTPKQQLIEAVNEEALKPLIYVKNHIQAQFRKYLEKRSNLPETIEGKKKRTKINIRLKTYTECLGVIGEQINQIKKAKPCP